VPLINLYSIRLKQYYLEALIISLLILVSLSWIKNRTKINFGRLVIVSIISMFFSFTSILLSFILINFSAGIEFVKSRKNFFKEAFFLSLIYNITLYFLDLD
jgi:hypothetical protein